MGASDATEREIDEAADAILAMPLGPAPTIEGLRHELDARVSSLLNLHGSPDRDITEATVSVSSRHLTLKGSYTASGSAPIVRLMVDIDFLSEPGMPCELAVVALVATKRATDVHDIVLGQTGADIGNSTLVARLLEICLQAFRRTGWRVVVNQPVNDELRRHYRAMGFRAAPAIRARPADYPSVTGALLDWADRQQLAPSPPLMWFDFDSKQCIWRALRFAEEAYETASSWPGAKRVRLLRPT